MWLLIAFIAVPIIEIALFLEVGGMIGTWPTIGIVLLTAVVGSYMMRIQGALAMSSLQASFNEMRDPTVPIASGAMILLAGALLVTPGFFTDTLGLLLLVPPFRNLVIKFAKSRMKVQTYQSSSFSTHQRYSADDDGVIDGDYARVDPDLPPVEGPSGWTKD
ncbi:FxsA family protein [Falsihalocynthiibacter sp. SS001]|uniref:FxsA family protein n=1 Tax=Falsihalocynthiibacter sp. SS001 TaxID=3349698 RepID=UPI0036D28D80